jgi:hypothetical protein
LYSYSTIHAEIEINRIYISETRYNTVAFDIILFFFFAEGKVIILKLDTVHPEITYKKI